MAAGESSFAGGGQFEYINSGAWTEIRGICAVGDKAYCSFEYGLMVVDISDPTAPHIRAQTLIPAGTAQQVCVSGQHAYVTRGDAGLSILDLSDPDTSVLVAQVTVPGWSYAVAVADSLLWLGGSDTVLRAYNVATPTSPTLVSSYPCPDWIMEIVVLDTLVFAACDDSGLYIFDAANPSAPVLIGRFNANAGLTALAVHDGFAFLGHYRGMTVVDVRNPTTPVTLDSLNIFGYKPGITAQSSTVYLATGSGLRVVDVADPTDITLSATYDVGSAVTDVALADTLAYLAIFNYSLEVINVTVPASPTFVSHIKQANRIGDVAVSGSTAYVAAYTDGLWAMDLSVAPGFSRRSQWGASRQINWVRIYDTLAYVGGNDSLYILSIANPDSPYMVGALPGSTGHVTVVDTLAFVCAGSSGLRIFDISDPTTPLFLGSYDTPGGAHESAVLNGVAYVADHAGGLQVIDVSDPTAPLFLASSPTSGGARAVIARDSLVFLADDHFGLMVYNVAVPQVPALIGSLPISPGLFALSEGSHILFGALPVEGGVYAIDAGDPSNPRLVAQYTTPGYAVAIEAVADTVYVGDISGLLVLGYVSPTGVVESLGHLPSDFGLLSNYPNPFNPSTTLRYWVESPSQVELTIHNLLGRKVKTLLNAVQPSGWHQIEWNGQDSRGEEMPTGVYIGILRSGSDQVSRKLLLLR